MRRGTTPTNTFTTDIDLSDAEVIFLTYKQKGRTVLEFDRSRITVTPENISVTLTQEETLAFSEKDGVRIQIRAKFMDDSAVASNIMLTSIAEILKDGVI